jgi:Zn-dependent protease with chaperone function
MPILLVLALTLACLQLIEWPEPLFGGGLTTAATFTGVAVLSSITASFSLRTWVVRTLRVSPGRRLEVAQVYGLLRRRLFFINIAVLALAILVFGWGWLTQTIFQMQWGDEEVLAPFAELAVPLPYFIMLLSGWLIYYDSERALHLTSSYGSSPRQFWSRTGYFLHHIRQFLMMVMLPVFLFVSQQTISQFCPETIQSEWYRAGSIASILMLVLFMPLAIKPLLGLRRMPSGPLRLRLEALARRLHFRCKDFLLWPTHGAMANAMIVGVLPSVRYVIFTDRILEDLPDEELDAVFGHEVGHAKHGHIWSYMLFLALSVTALAAGVLLVLNHLAANQVDLPQSMRGWLAAVPLLIVGAYFFLVFGFLSRRCERQADVYGCRAVSCNNPICLGHDAETVYPERAQGLCRTGIRTFINALQHVDMVNGSIASEEERGHSVRIVVHSFMKWLRSWQHSTMALRMAFLRSLIQDPRRERRFQRRVTALRWGLILGIAAVLVLLTREVGWRELVRVM